MNATLTAYDAAKPNYLTFSPETGIIAQMNQLMKSVNYQVVATDYTNYTLVYSCMTIPFMPSNCITVNLWVMSRARTVTDAQLATWNAILSSNSVLTSGLFRINQDGFTV
jgi:hypothetical protein